MTDLGSRPDRRPLPANRIAAGRAIHATLIGPKAFTDVRPR
jgi:hypothetical protein